jgi:hypothetical protein
MKRNLTLTPIQSSDCAGFDPNDWYLLFGAVLARMTTNFEFVTMDASRATLLSECISELEKLRGAGWAALQGLSDMGEP